MNKFNRFYISMQIPWMYSQKLRLEGLLSEGVLYRANAYRRFGLKTPYPQAYL